MDQHRPMDVESESRPPDNKPKVEVKEEGSSQMPNTDVGNESPPDNKPKVEVKEEGKLSPSDRAESPDTNCAICLGKLQTKSFPDSCLHQFCFTCLLEWSKVKAECPLCKQSFKSIIHNVRSIEDYDQYHLRPAAEPTLGIQNFSFLVNESNQHRSFRYRTTMVQPLVGFLHRLEHVVANRRVDHLIPPSCTIVPGHRSSVHWDSSNNRVELIHWGTSNDRRNVYRQNLWVRRTPDVTGRFRECSPEFFANNPAQLHRLVPWLNRELNVLLSGTNHSTQALITRIMDLVTRHPIRSSEFRNSMLRYFGSMTDHFLHEFYAFGTSPFDMIGYDRNTAYGPPSTIAHDDETDSESDSADSDIQIVDVVVRPQDDPSSTNVPSSSGLLRVGSPVAGPSGVTNLQDTCIAITSESESDPEDCMVVGTVKPRHLRTPEIITLDDDDDVVENEGGPNNNANLNNDNTNDNISSEDDFKLVIARERSSSRRKSSDSYRGSTSRRDQDNPPVNLKLLSALRDANRRLTYLRSCPSESSNRTSVSSSSNNSSGEEWGYSHNTYKSKTKCVKRKTRSLSVKKKDKESKKKNSKEKKIKPLKHWKKKLCLMSDSSDSSKEDLSNKRMPMKRKRRLSTTSTSSSSREKDNVNDDDDRSHSYSLPMKRVNFGTSSSSSHSSRLRSVVGRVRRDTQESNDSYSASTSTRARSYDGDAWHSASSSYHSSTYSVPQSSHHHTQQTRTSVLMERSPSRTSSVSSSSSSSSRSPTSSSSSSLSSTSSSTDTRHQRKHKHKRTKSKRKHNR